MIYFLHMEKLIQDFVSSLNRRQTTKETYGKALREFSKWLGEASPAGLGSNDIQKYKDYILSKNLSSTSMSAYLTAVRRFYDYLVSKGSITENPARKIKGSPRPRRHLTNPISRAEVEKLFSMIDPGTPLGSRDRAMLSLMARSGLSEIEIVRANLGDLRETGGRRVIYVQGKSKDKKDEFVALSPAAAESLDRYLEDRGPSGSSEPLFWGIGNRAVRGRITTRGVRARVNYYLELSGIKKSGVMPQSLRHTAAMLAIEEGASVSEVKRMLRLKTMESALVYFEEARELLDK